MRCPDLTAMMTRRQSDGFRVHRFRREKWSDDWIGTDGPLRPRQNFPAFQGRPTLTIRCHKYAYFLVNYTI